VGTAVMMPLGYFPNMGFAFGCGSSFGTIITKPSQETNALPFSLLLSFFISLSDPQCIFLSAG